MLPYLLVPIIFAGYAVGSPSLHSRDDWAERRKYIPHDDRRIHYLPEDAGFHPDCASKCSNEWWVEVNSSGLDAPTRNDSILRMHTTQGRSISLIVSFTGSKLVELVGKTEGKARSHMAANFTPSRSTRAGTNTEDQGVISAQKDFLPNDTYTMTMSYSGTDSLHLVAVAIETTGTFLTPSDTPSKTATIGSSETSSTISASSPGNQNPSQISGQTTPVSTSPSVHPRPKSSSSNRTGLPASATPPGSSHSGETVNVPDLGTQQHASLTSPSTRQTTTASSQPTSRRKGDGGLISGIIIGILIFLLILTLNLIYLRRRLKARRAPSYAFRTRTFREDAHWTERPISPIVPSSAEWESFALPLEKDGQVETKKQIQSVQTPLFDERRARSAQNLASDSLCDVG